MIIAQADDHGKFGLRHGHGGPESGGTQLSSSEPVWHPT